MNAKILQITLFINEKYPELSAYIEEMYVPLPTAVQPKINKQTLNSYFNSLQELLTKYAIGLPYLAH